MRRFLHPLLWALALLPTLVPAQAQEAEKAAGDGGTAVSVAQAIREAESDIEAARRELAEERARIAARREEMAATITELEQEIRELRNRRDRQREALATTRTAVEKTTLEADHAEELVKAAASLLVEHRRNLATRLSTPLSFFYEPALTAVDDHLNANSAGERLAAAAPLASVSLRVASEAFGGVAFPENALTPGGELTPGVFLEYGPFRYFVPDDRAAPAGLARQEADASRPVVFADFGRGNGPEAVRQLNESGSAKVPVDVTGGAATRLAAAKPQWHEHLAQGGFVMVPLLILAVVCLVLAVYKLIALAGIQLKDPEDRIRGILQSLEASGEQRALDVAGGLRPPLRAVIQEGIRHRDAPKESLEEVLYERLIAQTPHLERLLTPLAVCASTAPLLGLLGTVTGMIHTFRLITVFGTGDARALSSGISEALVTTEVGLAIAIPALLVHAFLSRRVNRAVANSQRAAITFVNGLTVRNQPDGGPSTAGRPADEADTPHDTRHAPRAT